MKNKQITIYDLMGLVKNDKAPNKIKYKATTYIMDDLECFYCNEKDRSESLFEFIFSIYDDYCALDETVTILDEENDEFEDIEELKVSDFITPSTNELEIMNKMNQLIKNQEWLCKKTFQISERLNKYE